MKEKLILYYDKECPFCSNYARFLELKKSHTLLLKNARESLDEIHVSCPGLDINEGMIIDVGGQCLQGVDALAYLDSIIICESFFARVHHSLWRLPPVFTHPLYSILKTLRKVILFIIGKKNKID